MRTRQSGRATVSLVRQRDLFQVFHEPGSVLMRQRRCCEPFGIINRPALPQLSTQMLSSPAI